MYDLLLHDETAALAAWASKRLAASWGAPPPDEVVRRLGARASTDRVEFGFWVPGLATGDLAPGSLALELFTPLEPIRWGEAQEVAFRKERLPLEPSGAFVWAVTHCVAVGSRESFGAFYRLRWRDRSGAERVHLDPLARSLPFGSAAPAELYDAERLAAARGDLPFFRRLALSGSDDEPSRVAAPGNLLEIHVPTATESGTLGELADLYRHLAGKVERSEPLEPAERAFVGYDAVLLLPVEPPAPPRDAGCWREVGAGDDAAEDAPEDTPEATVRVALRRPTEVLWGRDASTAAASAVNPALLRSGRPDELADLATTLHTFPGKPVRLVLDLALERVDTGVGPGTAPGGGPTAGEAAFARAVRLEAQRRKVDLGADGIRVGASADPDGADLLRDTVGVVQRAGEMRFRPFVLVEAAAGGPPAEPDAAPRVEGHGLVWGPPALAEVAPHRRGGWEGAWGAVEAATGHGPRRLGGFDGPDALRRATRGPLDEADPRLGASPPEIVRRAFDLPAAIVLVHALPGVPKDFIAASLRSPWLAPRGDDALGTLAWAAGEAGFFAWRGDPFRYGRDDAFVRLKALGATDPEAARRLLADLRDALAAAPASLAEVAAAMGETPSDGIVWDEDRLGRLAEALVADPLEYAKVWHYKHDLDPEATAFALAVREFRRGHAWLADAFGPRDRLVRDPGGSGRTVAYRASPDGSEEVLAALALGGEGFAATLDDLAGSASDEPAHREGGHASGWTSVAPAPGVRLGGPDESVGLPPGAAVLFYRQR